MREPLQQRIDLEIAPPAPKLAPPVHPPALALTFPSSAPGRGALASLLFAACSVTPSGPAVSRCPDGGCPSGLACDAGTSCAATPILDGGSSGGAPFDAGVDAGPPIALGIPARCNPLRGADPEDCLTPWPSLTYERASAGTPSGYQLDVPIAAMPVSSAGTVVDPALLNLHDGFSPAAAMVVHFDQAIDGSSLPGWENLTASLSASSPTQILAPDGSRVLHFAELDATNAPPRQALYVRPMVRLAPKTRYVVVLLRSLTDQSGAPLPIPAGMEALLSGRPTDNARLEALRPDFSASVLPVLAKAGLSNDQVLLAWDFVTGSDDGLTAHVRSMRDQALAQIGDGSSVTYTLTTVDGGPNEAADAGEADGGAPQLYARIVGTYTVPLFLTADGGAEATLALDDAGVPQMQGSYPVTFAALVPSAIRTATPDHPVPVVVFGHGLLGDAVEYSANPQIQQAAEENHVLMVMTNWTGLAKEDVGAIAAAVNDMNQLPLITDKLQQSIVNAMVLLRFARTALAHDPVLEPNGQEVIDPTNAYYYGISLGGIMGGTFMAYDPDVPVGVLNVPGGCWSLMLQRSNHWTQLGASTLFDAAYPDGVDQAVLSSYTQPFFDFSDPITTAPYLLSGSPLTVAAGKRILMQESRWDMQVPNQATEMVARTMAIPLMLPTDDTPYGLVGEDAPLPSALTIYDFDPAKHPPVTNAPNDQSNGAHDDVYPSGAAQRQVTAFLQPDGEAIQACTGDGGCVCAAPADACN